MAKIEFDIREKARLGSLDNSSGRPLGSALKGVGEFGTGGFSLP